MQILQIKRVIAKREKVEITHYSMSKEELVERRRQVKEEFGEMS